MSDLKPPRLFLTCMSGSPSEENAVEMIEPVLSHLDGVIWVLNDVPPTAPVARYLESVKGLGRIIHRAWPRGRHHVAMNDTLFCGPMVEGDAFFWVDDLERPMLPFVSRIKSEIWALMQEADLDVIAAWGKPYLMRYHETLEYRNSPHWSLHGWNGRGMEWSTIEPDETKVRFNARPSKRGPQDGLHWIGHYAKYWIEYPPGSNHAALGIEQWGGDPNQAFAKRETQRLAFREEMRHRGVPLTVDGLKTLLTGPLDETLKNHLRAEKTLSDFYHYLHGRGAELRDTHRPSDALPLP